jgi:hypothetical protein
MENSVVCFDAKTHGSLAALVDTAANQESLSNMLPEA